MTKLLTAILLLSANAANATTNMLTDVSLMVSSGRVSRTAECMANAAVSQLLPGKNLEKILMSGIESSNSTGLSKFAFLAFQTRDGRSGNIETFKARLASLDGSVGWLLLQDGSDLYPFTPVAASMATLEGVNPPTTADFFSIETCQ